MTGSLGVDLLVIAIVLLAAISGYRQGAAASTLAFIGVIVGVIAGVMVAPHIVANIDDDRLRLVTALLLLIGLVIIGEISGMVLGRAARGSLHSPTVRRIDSVVGSGVQVLAILIAAWLLAVPIRSSQQTEIVEAVEGSKVLTAVDKLAPQWMRDLPQDFTELLDTSGFKEVMGPFGETQVATVDAPDETLADRSVIAAVRPSVIKVLGVAHSCGQALEGSGFVISPERVMTNAHVVAGTDEVSISTPGGQSLAATVVWFDSRDDVAVLDVPGLRAKALELATQQGRTGDDAIVLGYPEDGPFTVTPVRIRNVVNLVGPDIYQRPETVERQVYTVRGQIRSGNSGGPMIDPQGRVLGLVFGAAENPADDTGFVLTAEQIRDDVARSEQRSSSASTGNCVAVR